MRRRTKVGLGASLALAGAVGCSSILGLAPEETTTWSQDGESTNSAETGSGRDTGAGTADASDASATVSEGGTCVFDVSKFDDRCVFGP